MNVVRFTLSTARDLYVSGVGAFSAGVLDIDANNVTLLTRARYLLTPYRATEIGIVDSTTPKPTLPAVPVAPVADPYPQYVLDADLPAASAPPADASTTVKGLVELATTTETKTGTDTARAGTPAALKASVGELAAASTEVRAASVTAIQAVAPMTLRIGGKLWIFLGDSITNGSASTNASTHSFRGMAGKILGSARLTGAGINGGVAGNNSAQALARVDALLAANPTAQGMFVLLGTNDASQGVTPADFRANVIAIKAKADAARIPIAFGLVPPRVATATAENALVRQYNAWLRAWTRLLGIPCADTWGALADPATGALAAAYNTSAPDGTGGAGDGTHPNNAGHAAMGVAVAAALAPLCPPLLPWPLSAGGAGLMTDPLAVSSGYGVISGPVTNAGQAVISRTDWPEMLAPTGRRITIDNSAGGSSTSTTIGRSTSTGYAEGDKLMLVTQIRIGSGSVKVQLMDGSTAKTVSLDAPYPSVLGPIAGLYTVPAGGIASLRAALVVTAPANSTASIDVGGLDIANLTAQGVADLY